MAVRHILSQTGLQQMHQGVLWASSISLQKNLFSVLRSSSDESDRPDERQVSRKVSRFVIKHSSLTGRILHINCEHQATLMYQVIVLCFAANIPGPRSTCGRNERAIFRRWCEGSSWYSRSGALLTAKHRLSMMNICFAVT